MIFRQVLYHQGYHSADAELSLGFRGFRHNENWPVETVRSLAVFFISVFLTADSAEPLTVDSEFEGGSIRFVKRADDQPARPLHRIGPCAHQQRSSPRMFGATTPSLPPSLMVLGHCPGKVCLWIFYSLKRSNHFCSIHLESAHRRLNNECISDSRNLGIRIALFT